MARRDSRGRYLPAAVEIGLNDNLTSPMRRLTRVFDLFGKSGRAAAKGVSAATIAAGNLVSAGVVRGLGAVKDGFIGSVTEAIEFESSMADVKKVLSDADLANFGKLTEGVRDLSQNIGIAPGEVAKLTASLAQSGIAGQELLKTAEDASKLAVAFDMTGEESGQALAKLRTGLGISRDEVNSLTGTINVLSNNLAATAPEILRAVKQVGSVGKAANLSGQTVAALSTAMIASGAGAEVAATGTQNFIRAIAAGSSATKRQQGAFRSLGLNSRTVAKELTKGGKEAEAVIRDIVLRIGQLKPDKRLPVLIEMFGAESIGAIGPLATNIDLLTKSFELAGNRTAALGSVESEFASRSATTKQALEKLKASVTVLAIEFGEHMLPYLRQGAEFLTSPEGKEWGRKAVAKAAETVRDLAAAGREILPVVIEVVKGISSLVEQLGGTGTAALLATPKIISMAAAFGGPAGLGAAVLIASTALGAFLAHKTITWFDEWNTSLVDAQANLEGVARSLADGQGPLAEWTKRMQQQAESADESRRQFARLMIQLQGGDVGEFDRREGRARAEREKFAATKSAAAARDAEWANRLAQGQAEAQARGIADQNPYVAAGAPLEAKAKAPPIGPQGAAATPFSGELKVTIDSEGQVKRTEMRQSGAPGFQVRANRGRQ